MNGWDEFLGYIRDVRAQMEDQWAPVGLICLQADPGPDGSVALRVHESGAIIWPQSFPVAERGPLLERLAKPYRLGTVLRNPTV